jgi:hypothetical protein
VAGAALVAVLGAACARDAGPHEPAGLRLVLADSVVLQEPDSVALGRFAYATREPDGSILLSDARQGRLLRYGRNGRLAAVIGRKGGAPGEFGRAGRARPLAGDSFLAVVDPSRFYLSLLDRRTGAFVRGQVVPFQDVGQTWTVRGDTVVFGLQPSTSLVGRWNWRTGAVVELGQLPPAVAGSGAYYFQYGQVEAVPTESGYIAQVPTVPGLQLLDRDGRPTGTVAVPAVRRRGTPDDLLERHRQSGNGATRFFGSVAITLDRLPSGNLAVVSADLDVVREAPREYGNIRFFLSVVSADFERACVDLPIPFESDELYPWPSFADGRLIVITRRLAGDDAVSTVVHTYEIRDDHCDWIPTGGVGAPLLGAPQ